MIKQSQGFTLIEMVMVMVILGIILGMIAPLLNQGLTTFNTGENLFMANWQGQLALERMSRDLFTIRSPSDLTTMSANSLTFTDSSNNVVSYGVASNQLNLTLNGNTAVLATGVQTLNLTYFNSSGTTASLNSEVRLIRITLSIALNNATYTLTTAVYPRNFN